MIAEVLIVGLQLATLVALTGKKKDVKKTVKPAVEPPKSVEPRKEKVETKVAPRREPKISNSGERFVACPLEGYQSYYLVGDWGTIKTKDGRVLCNTRARKKLKVNLANNITSTTCTVERLVALAYLVRPAKGDEKTHRILHKNGDIDDNRAVNLMWK